MRYEPPTAVVAPYVATDPSLGPYAKTLKFDTPAPAAFVTVPAIAPPAPSCASAVRVSCGSLKSCGRTTRLVARFVWLSNHSATRSGLAGAASRRLQELLNAPTLGAVVSS